MSKLMFVPSLTVAALIAMSATAQAGWRGQRDVYDPGFEQYWGSQDLGRSGYWSHQGSNDSYRGHRWRDFHRR